jgi:uracil-DNA glycosylase
MNLTNLHLNNDWIEFLQDELESDSFKLILKKVDLERKRFVIFPKNELVFYAFNKTPLSKVKVVILGQDPYHGKNQAHGLSFSVPNGIKNPPSLRNIFKELNSDLKIPISENGDLTSWARQGVLLLNATLTVREKEAGSHQKIGWENFTNAIISKLSTEKKGVVFLLWGAFAQKKAALIDSEKHYVLETSHPSPFSAYRGFLGSNPFSKTNEILINNNQKPIDWNLCSDTLTLF